MLKLLFKKNYKKDTFQMLSIRFKINKGSVFTHFPLTAVSQCLQQYLVHGKNAIHIWKICE